VSLQELLGKVQTVLGPLDADDLGITLAHEHLINDVSYRFREPEAEAEKALAYMPISIENLCWLAYNPTKCLDNLRMCNEDLVISEVLHFKKAGGGTIVDMTNNGLGRDPKALVRISKATGLNIIMGSGYYTGSTHPADLADKEDKAIAEEIIRDIKIGAGDTGIRSGMIGEIGCSYPLTEGERKIVSAAAQAQKQTGAPVNIHPGQNKNSPFDIIEVLRQSGGDIKHTVISHVANRLGRDIEKVIELAETGSYIEYDTFGQTGHPSSLKDWQRIECIKQLIDHGYLKQILLSQDIFLNMRLRRYGGCGYDHILTNILPLMKSQGITEDQIHTMFVENPARMLRFS